MGMQKVAKEELEEEVYRPELDIGESSSSMPEVGYHHQHQHQHQHHHQHHFHQVQNNNNNNVTRSGANNGF